MSDDRKQDCPVAVHALITRSGPDGNEVLMGLRQNTDYGNGCWSLPAGHKKLGERRLDALCREMDEELGITLVFQRLTKPLLVIDHLKDYGADTRRPQRFVPYKDIYFAVPAWVGDLRNNEPAKCAELAFHPLACLPDNTLPLTRFALECLGRDAEIRHARFGWDNPARRSQGPA